MWINIFKEKNMKPSPLNQFFERFKENEEVLKLAREVGFKDIDDVIEVDRSSGDKGDSRTEEFHDGLIDLINENPEEVDSMELECLSSYSTTTEFHLREFCGVYWIDNFEFGGLSFFASEEDAKSGFKEEYGIEWGSEESPFVDVDVEKLNPDND